MHAVKALIIAGFAVLGVASTTAASDIVVIVNKDGAISTMSKADVKRAYTGRMSTVDGVKLVPLNQPLDSAIAAEFIAEYVDMSVEEYREYWVDQQVRGRGTAPMIQRNDQAVKAVVAQVPGAIAYIRRKSLDDSVRRLRVQ